MQIKFPRVCIMVQIDMNIFDEEHSETPINKVKHLEIVARSHAQNPSLAKYGKPRIKHDWTTPVGGETSINSC